MSYWGDIIDAAESRRKFSTEEIDESISWVTCACGQQDPRIPRYTSGMPHDGQLGSLGGDFAIYVANHNFKGARKTLAKIEERAAEVLGELDEG